MRSSSTSISSDGRSTMEKSTINTPCTGTLERTSSTLRSPPIAKRFKITRGSNGSSSYHDDDFCSVTTAATAAVEDRAASASTAQPVSSPSVGNIINANANNKPSPLENDLFLNHILSFLGDGQYRFIGSVNQEFHKSYLSLYPVKNSYMNTSTIEHSQMIWDDIEAMRVTFVDDDETLEAEEMKKDLRDRLWDSAALFGNLDVVKHVQKLLESVNADVDYKELADQAIKHNRKAILNWLLKDVGYDEWKEELCRTAARYGHLSLLEWACGKLNCAMKLDPKVCQNAIGNGHMDLFIWAENKGFVWNEDDETTLLGTCLIAAHNGQLMALQWLYDNCGCESDTLNECCYFAAREGHVEVIQWLLSIGCTFNQDILACALQGHHLEMADFLLTILTSTQM